MAAAAGSCNEIQGLSGGPEKSPRRRVIAGRLVVFGVFMCMLSYGANEACQPLPPRP
jgi:hypothetical protein